VDFISPLDDRYYSELRDFATSVSERAFVKYRLRIETLYLDFLINLLSKVGIVKPLTSNERDKLLSLEFSDEDYARFRELEGRLGHDVKATEYLLREKLSNAGLSEIARLVHLGLTSEDVNNLALNVLIKIAVYKHLIPELTNLLVTLTHLANEHVNTPMLGRTHGQPATPTTFGKEMAYHAYRICYWLWEIISIKLQGKVSGATGSLASFKVITNEANWLDELMNFVHDLGLEPALVTTQILPADSLTHLLTSIALMAQTLINLTQDLWLYNMIGYVHVSGKPVGSSTMPHKVNPVDLENAEGNFKLGSSILMEISRYIQVSRLQRDLSDSTIKRNIGLGIGHVILGIKRLTSVLNNIKVDVEVMSKELNEHWETLSEAVQVRLRVLGMKDAYEKSLTLFRGLRLSRTEYIEALSRLGADDPMLMNLNPHSYIGYAREVTINTINHCNEVLSTVKTQVDEELSRLRRLGFLNQ
jgi:adenylosuccinate lyase